MTTAATKFSKIESSEIDSKNLFSDNIDRTINFIQENYLVKIPIHDPSKIQIEPRETIKDLYPYAPPSVDDIYMHLYQEGISISETILKKIIRSPNRIKPCNPVKEYFDHIRGKFKGESHIDILFRHIKARIFDNDTSGYYQTRSDKLIKKWLVACVACWVGGVPNDVALGLVEGIGGVGKTHFTRFLLPEELRDYYVQASDDTTKFDMEDAFTRYMLVNFDEMCGLNRRNTETFKKVMSEKRLLTKHRRDEFAIHRPRLACGIFTSNYNQERGGFLLDEFGLRRFGTIEITDIDLEYSNIVDVDQIWAEALMLFESAEFKYRFDQEDYPELVAYNSRYLKITDAMFFLQRYLEIPTSRDEENVEKMTTTMIFNRLRQYIGKDDIKKININSIGVALNAMGFERASMRIEGKSDAVRGYYVIVKD
ncbi:MAG: VapE family protein [Dysgonamonadaceae bacterium]